MVQPRPRSNLLDGGEGQVSSTEGGPEGHGCHRERGGATERGAAFWVLTSAGWGHACEVSSTQWPPRQGPISQGLGVWVGVVCLP